MKHEISGAFDESSVRARLERFRSGESTIEEVLSDLRQLPFRDLGFARLDSHRQLRRGFPEVIFGEGKSLPQTVELVDALMEAGGPVLVTRTCEAVYLAVRERHEQAVFDAEARTVTVVGRAVADTGDGTILILSAGTSDRGVALEALRTAEIMGNATEFVCDVGVAGIHRLLAELPKLAEARVVIAVAGMEGALPSVVAGLVGVPVVAVPTSIGYGASFGGVAALLAMLNSCASGVTVVNIDNGFGAGFAASLINHLGPTSESRKEV